MSENNIQGSRSPLSSNQNPNIDLFPAYLFLPIGLPEAPADAVTVGAVPRPAVPSLR